MEARFDCTLCCGVSLSHDDPIQLQNRIGPFEWSFIVSNSDSSSETSICSEGPRVNRDRTWTPDPSLSLISPSICQTSLSHFRLPRVKAHGHSLTLERTQALIENLLRADQWVQKFYLDGNLDRMQSDMMWVIVVARGWSLDGMWASKTLSRSSFTWVCKFWLF